MPGNGAWLWIELNPGGTGDYAGAICIHTGPAGLNGAESDTGDVTWSDTAGTLTITGITAIHDTVPLTITVPDSYTHSTEPSASVMTPNLITGGTAQIQVAPKPSQATPAARTAVADGARAGLATAEAGPPVNHIATPASPARDTKAGPSASTEGDTP